jgi:hypothetical protein
MPRVNYEVVQRSPQAVVIRDVGPWSRYMTVTNAAEDVVMELLGTKVLLPGARLFYYDTDGVLDELCHDGRAFTGFAPGPR